jgi:hypothetical protein
MRTKIIKTLCLRENLFGYCKIVSQLNTTYTPAKNLISTLKNNAFCGNLDKVYDRVAQLDRAQACGA